ncbi:MAG: hypothetical protein ACPGJS_13605 [Flammeovirgaceae bacterium]
MISFEQFQGLLQQCKLLLPTPWAQAHARFLEEDIIEKTCMHLVLLQQGKLTPLLLHPQFKEEVIPARKRIFSELLSLVHSIQPHAQLDAIAQEWNAYFTSTSFENILVLLGMRFTPASLKTVAALPPPTAQLLHQAFLPFNAQISCATRAWEKHVGRSDDDFWGKVQGSPAQKEAFAKAKVLAVLQHATWWNTFVHYKHGVVYEFRVPSGHGVRWKKEGITFLGFLEPFLD